jgi:hypothetical protein
MNPEKAPVARLVTPTLADITFTPPGGYLFESKLSPLLVVILPKKSPQKL